MDRQTVQTKLEAVQAEFDSLQAESQKNVERNEAIAQRLYELRGQYTAYEQMLGDMKDPATTLTAEPAQEASHGKRTNK